MMVADFRCPFCDNLMIRQGVNPHRGVQTWVCEKGGPGEIHEVTLRIRGKERKHE